jgi:hypothetical protein
MKNGQESLKIISIDADSLTIEFFNLNNFKDTVKKLKDSGFEIFGTEKTASRINKARIEKTEIISDYELYNKYPIQRSL